MKRILKGRVWAEFRRWKTWLSQAFDPNPDEQAALMLTAALFVLGILARFFFA